MIAVRLPEEMEKMLNRYAKETERTKTDIVKDALKLFFQTKAEKKAKTPYELGRDLFGRYESNSSGDLSETYKERMREKLREKYSTH